MTSPFLLGAFAPVFKETTARSLSVDGHIPVELDGLFTQIGPNPLRPPRHTDVDRYQWFAQDGMVSGVRLRDGRAEWFRNRWIRSTRVTTALHERRTPGRRHFPIGTVHTNVVTHAGMLLALVETGCAAVQLTPDLGTVRYTDLGGALPHGASAHPKFDPQTGELHAVVYSPLRTWAEYRILNRDGALLSAQRLSLHGRPMLHDIALTAGHVVLFDLPVRFHVADAIRGRFPYGWDESHQSKIGIVSRRGPANVRWFPIEPCFLFHTLDAVETDDRITIRAIRYRRLFDSGAADPLTQGGQLWEWTIDLNSGQASERQLDDHLQELPRINPHRVAGAARFHYGITAGPQRIASHSPEALLKFDAKTGLTQIRRPTPRQTPSEAVFIPRPVGDGVRGPEDDGWLMHFMFDEDLGTSQLIILDAQHFTDVPVAVVHLPVKVPFGFHSSWIPGSDLG